MATNDEIIAKLPLALVELRKQNKDAATKAAEDRAKEFEVLMSSRDALVVGSDERKAMNSELAKMRNQDSRLAARAKEAAASTAGQAVALKEELEKQGKIAEDNKEFQRLSYEARKEDYAQRLADATSPAAKKEIREEARADAKKNGSRLDKIAAGIGGLFEMGKKGLNAAKLGGLAILSTLAIGAFVIALGKFLQSDTFKKMTKYIFDTIIPKLKEFYNAFFGEDGGLFKGIKALFGDDSGVGAVVIGLTAVTALFAVAKLAKVFGPLKAGVTALLSGIGGLAKRIPGVPGGGAAGKGGAASKVGAASKAGGKGGGLGKGIGGMLRGIAAGLGAMANPATLVGLLAVVAAVVALSAAIRIMRPAFEPIGKMFESFGETVKTVFEGLGVIIKDIGESIGKVITAIGDSIGNIIDKITSMKTAGTEATTKQIKELSAIPGNLMLETARGIDAIKKALDGFGGGTFSKIAGSLFGGSGPIDKIIKLSEKVPALMKASEAIAILGAAGSDFAKAETEIKRRERIAELKGTTRMGIGAEGRRQADAREIAALESQAMPMGAGGGSNFSAQSKNMITAAINAADLTLIEKDRVRREAEFKTASAGASGGQTNIVDARQSSSVTTTGQSGNSPIINPKYANRNAASF
jgi:hypothetical protein